MSSKACESFWMFFNPLVVKREKIHLKEICSDFSFCIIIWISHLLSPVV